MFGAEEDDELMDIVLGEDGENDLETLDDGIGAGELEDEVTGDESEKPTADSNGDFEIDDFDTPGDDIDCDKFGVADANDSREPDEEDIECGEFDRAEKASGIDELDEAANELFSLDEGKCSAKTEEDVAASEDIDESDEENEDDDEETEESAIDIDELANSLFTESEDEIEDAIIDTVEDNDETMSDAEADSYEAIEDDDIIDSILGECD